MVKQFEAKRLWSVILAGGEGRRMRPLIRRWLGYQKPKQYCTFVGTRSMFQHTVDRADGLIAPHRRVTVIAAEHRAEVLRQMGRRHPGTIALQPVNVDTAAGVFLPLTRVRALDPGAAVAVFPSDHFICPDDNFIETVRNAAASLRIWPEHIILVGAPPDWPDTEYGWIDPGEHMGWSSGRALRTVRSFVEKPQGSVARQCLDKGGLWNTFVFVARVKTLWDLGLRCFPRLVELFEQLQAFVGQPREMDVLRDIYSEMPAHNFSSDLLARSADRTAVIELRDVLWSDWGRPERIARTLQMLGRQPAFPKEYLKVG